MARKRCEVFREGQAEMGGHQKGLDILKDLT
jgi:hypothetical protein